MPDIWTKHPEIVRDLLKEAGFRCGVEGRFLKGRDPAWTCAFDGKAMYGDLYIHHVNELRAEAPLHKGLAGAQGAPADMSLWSIPLLALVLGVAIVRRLKRTNRP